jgi:DNA repair photolyase
MKKFNPLNVSSKILICAMPLRVDSYRECTFGCHYCFATKREVLGNLSNVQIGDINYVKNKLKKIYIDKKVIPHNILDNLLKNRTTWHYGGMSDPFCHFEKKFNITQQIVDIANEYKIKFLFSTKSDTTYNVNINPELHSFQLSVSSVDNPVHLEKNVPPIADRKKFYDKLKKEGFKVSIRIQPFIPNLTDDRIIDMFPDADHFSIEGIKLVPQNLEYVEKMCKLLNIDRKRFKNKGLLHLTPAERMQMYNPVIEKIKKYNLSYSIADNDLRFMSTDFNCCGDKMAKGTGIDTTAMIKKYGFDYPTEKLIEELEGVGLADCNINHLFASNRAKNKRTLREYANNYKKNPKSPISANKYQIRQQKLDF